MPAKRFSPPTCYIRGIGYYLPPEIRKNSWWNDHFQSNRIQANPRTIVFDGDLDQPTGSQIHDLQLDQERIQSEQRKLMDQVRKDPNRGTKERRVASIPPSKMEIRAASAALEDAKLNPSEIGAIIVASTPGDHLSPNNATTIQMELGCSAIPCLGVDSACTSFLTGLNQLYGLLAVSDFEHGLLVVSSQFTQLTSSEDPLAKTAGDGAAAVILSRSKGIQGILSHVQCGYPHWRDAVRCGSSDGTPFWRGESPIIGKTWDEERSRELIMNCSYLARKHFDLALDRAGVDRQEIRHFHCHQATAWMNAACKQACGLEHTQTVNTFDRIANVGAANIPINLSIAKQAGHFQDGDLIATFSLGMGVTIAASILRWIDDSCLSPI